MPELRELRAQRCHRDECPVCRMAGQLIEDGAERVMCSDLHEQSCHLYVSLSDNRQENSGENCWHGLRIDRPEAGYRRIARGAISRMCDFAVLANSDDNIRFVLVELKSGVAYGSDIDQLAKGLELLHRYSDDTRMMPAVSACFVVGREIDKFRFSVRDKLASLKFGQRTVKLEILECGATLRI